jgi:glycosyltransferase involved in cell wall biosynthesis
MKFSVLISVYYKENPLFLEEALTSIEEQTLAADEIVLVKDGLLTVELDEVIAHHSKFSKVPYTIVVLEENVGLGEALNEGMKHCSYDWVARMDGDDISLPDRFEKQISYLEKHPDIDVLGSWISEFDEDPDSPNSFRKPPATHTALLAYAKYASPLNHMTVVYRKEAVLSAGSYKSEKCLEDHPLWIRMFMNGSHFANMEEVLVYARTGRDMIKRRHGIKYFKIEVALAQMAYKIGFISRYEYIRNLFLRALPRIMPLFILKKLYVLARRFTNA